MKAARPPCVEGVLMPPTRTALVFSIPAASGNKKNAGISQMQPDN